MANANGQCVEVSAAARLVTLLYVKGRRLSVIRRVAVNIDSGEPRLRGMLSVFAGGRILNARTARSQIIGGMIGALGGALYEEGGVNER